MANILKCKMCGGDIEVSQDMTVGKCLFCGSTMTLPRIDSEKKARLFNRANEYRLKNEFDKAYDAYKAIAEEDEREAEAYWGMVLSEYGVEYVEDPKNGNRMPTCHRTLMQSIRSSANFQLALQYADTEQKSLYQDETEILERLQRDILAVSSKEEPYDVFICYKETDDATKERTRDSVYAQEIYYQLTQEGFRVFFSRITLEEKAGTEYEPYIFAALNSAKVMIVLGSCPEYFNAVWVKNEWSRFISLMKKDKDKLLIPCYREMDPYDLPDQLSILQSYDMSKIGFIQDLIRGIKKVVNVSNPQVTVNEPVVLGNIANTEALLKRAYLALEDGEWGSCNEFCEQVLNQDPENAQAYLGKMMAELHVRRQEDLINCEQPFDNNKNYQKAVRFGGDEIAGILVKYNDTINERNRNKRFIEVYNNAITTMNSADSEYDYKMLAETFISISGFRDADSLVEKCLEKAEECHKNLALSSEQKRATVKKVKKTVVIASSIIAFTITILVLLITVIIPSSKYSKAMKYYDHQEYGDAYKLFNSIIKYKDSSEKASECMFLKQKAELTDVNIGSIIKFGVYEQDNDLSNGKEEIEWKVLDIAGDKALVISQYALDCQQYNSELCSVSWNDCTLRTWLNKSFYSNAFGLNYQNMIVNTNGDNIFLLSEPQVKKYFDSYDACQCRGTAFCYAQGAHKDSNGNCRWWLSDTAWGERVYIVSGSGIYIDNTLVIDRDYAVRPAMWIRIGQE